MRSDFILDNFRFCLFLFYFHHICSRWSFVDVQLIFSCPADHVLDWQPRILLGEALSLNVKNTHTLDSSIALTIRA